MKSTANSMLHTVASATSHDLRLALYKDAQHDSPRALAINRAAVVVLGLLGLLMDGQLDAATAAMAKYWTTDLHCKVIDQCLQMFGGFGYMWEYPIARAYADARVARIYGGANEIMKEIISRTL